MIEVKYKVKCEGNARQYGIKNGDWINKDIYRVVKKDVRSKGEHDIFYSNVAIYDDGKMVKIKKNGKFEEVK